MGAEFERTADHVRVYFIRQQCIGRKRWGVDLDSATPLLAPAKRREPRHSTLPTVAPAPPCSLQTPSQKQEIRIVHLPNYILLPRLS